MDPMKSSLAYDNYWCRKQRLAGDVPHFPVRGWWRCDDLCPIERLYFEAVRQCASLLDVGAGDLRIQRKIQAAGYRGTYHTVDISREYDYTYADLADVQRDYEAILSLDVIEHLPLAEGLELLDRLLELLTPGGVLLLQTPNARCVRHPLGWDMTHLHCYNLPDLWAHLTCKGLSVNGYRVVLRPPRRSLIGWARFLLGAFVTSRLLGCDYADNIALIARKNK
jgi:SAM-dependent methyltransferase